jgi:hypothetical protein
MTGSFLAHYVPTKSAALLVPRPGRTLIKLKRLICLLSLVLTAATNTKADTLKVYVDGSYAFADPSGSGYAIGPYGGKLGSQSVLFYCVDFRHDISGQTGWDATPTYLLSDTSLSSNATLLKNADTYTDIAWLLTQMMGTTDQKLQAEYQWTIWALTGGAGVNPYASDFNGIMTKAKNAVNGGWFASGWEILTPVSGSGYPNKSGYYGQEFMVLATPEPGSLLLLFTGLMALVILTLKR